ncbi:MULTISPECIES: DUF6758 family protein [Actinomadura]|uniref:Phosphotransacetylase n=1 Tax=Actinomadura litoris TaxID=2678616 RepID=A0A7K1L5Q7_9ACTN|nr:MULTISPECIES: DUF6758 family protein [Actinomadura]MBT2208531.1 hypothetical protein [Actinomadura sp. NEAU-AAG7]MUN39761.1 hypothetical protein [Actinomadura litoris]
MRAEPTCPRCAGPLHAPGLWSSDWSCGADGAVLPRQPSKRPGPDGLAAVVRDARVPVWTPWPLPLGWLVTGFTTVGDERSGARAVALAVSGPGLLSGPADMVVIAEEPGIGLGAHYAGLEGGDPGEGFDADPPHVKLDVSGPTATSGRVVPMWAVGDLPDRAVFVGEAMGDWLWVVLWPAEAGVLLVERQHLLDLREPGMEIDLPYGAHTPRLDE